MINLDSNTKIYLATGHTDMRKGVNGLSVLAQRLLNNKFCTKALFVFRGKGADKIKILWYDNQGFCLYYKCLDRGKFVWPETDESSKLGITKAQALNVNRSHPLEDAKMV